MDRFVRLHTRPRIDGEDYGDEVFVNVRHILSIDRMNERRKGWERTGPEYGRVTISKVSYCVDLEVVETAAEILAQLEPTDA